MLPIIGFLCMVFSPTFLIPALLSLYYGDGEFTHFILSFVAVFVLGLLLWTPSHGQTLPRRKKDGFLVVVLFWMVLSVVGASPFLFGLQLSPVDAWFESVSGLTTTGATVISGLDLLPRSMLFYRQELQWFGGMGLIVLAVAVLPLLGIGGMSMYRAETPGPMKEDKLAPRLAGSARILWVIYVGLTLACALAFWVAGMTPFDAVAHSLSTISTGGFSTHDASFAYFDSVAAENVATLFMILGAINFSIHYLVWHNRRPGDYLRDAESRTFLVLVVAVVLLVAVALKLTGYHDGVLQALEQASFEVVSVVTSTGYGIDDFSGWPLFLPLLMILISFIGGCGGSTAGGMKVMRVLVLAKMGYREIIRLPHPKGIFPVTVGGRVLKDETLQAIRGFFSLYIMTFVILMLLMMLAGLDQISAFSAVATCMNNLGPGLGTVAQTFGDVSDMGKLVAVAAMLLGRLEIFSVLVLFHPDFWRD